jgi:hypothetical protein
MNKPDPTPPLRNVHIADQLGELKAQLRPLQQQFKKLGAQLLALPPNERRGEDWFAQVSIYTKTTLDLNAMKKEFGLERLRQFMRKKSHERLDMVKNRKGKNKERA